MPRNLTPYEQILYATVRIEAENDKIAWVATGFFYRLDISEREEVILLISKRHVFEDAAHVTFWCHLRDKGGGASGKQADIEIDLKNELVIYHPDDQVDLAAVLIGPWINDLLRRGESPFIKAVDSSTLPAESDWDSFDAVQDLLMLGCPLGLFDEHNRFPIFRRGISASHLGYRYKGRDEFLIDVAAFEGSSGSPIFVNLERKYNRNTGIYEQSGLATDVKLVGILTSGPQYSHEGEVTFAQKGKVTLDLPLHLGLAVKSTAISALEIIAKQRCGG